jgi:hypothetical protein
VTPGTHRRAVQPDGAQGLDVWITSALSQDSEQGADNDYLQVGGGDDVYYSLVRFNLEGLPPVARKAIVWFYALPASNPVEMYLDRIEGPWDESTRWKDQPSAAFVLTVGAPPVNEWLGLDITHMYNGWKAGYPNWGIRLRPSEAESGFNSFVSSDAPDATLRPILLVLDTCGLGRGDWNCDCDKDLADFAALAVCYSGADSEPAYVSPSLDCLGSFDYDIDNDIDEANWADFASLTGPAH